MEFSFERLIIWNKSRELVKQVYLLTAKFPKEERYSLSDQLRRAAVSVASNIAEGTGRVSKKEKVHFIEIANGSLMEVICQISLAIDLGMAEDTDMDEIRPLAEELARQLSAYRRSMLDATKQ